MARFDQPISSHVCSHNREMRVAAFRFSYNWPHHALDSKTTFLSEFE